MKRECGANGAGGVVGRDEVRRSRQMEQNRKIGSELDEPCEPTVMSLKQMLEQLVLIESTGDIVNTKTMRVRKKSAARDTYAASLSDTGRGSSKVLTLDLWMEHQKRKSVDVLTWWPGKPEFCHPPEGSDVGNRAYNIWRGFKPFPKPKGDLEALVTPFLDHVAFLVPDERECRRFLQWLGAHFADARRIAANCISDDRGDDRHWTELAGKRAGAGAAGICCRWRFDQ